jgi:amino acid adenylation domain-containing protein
LAAACATPEAGISAVKNHLKEIVNMSAEQQQYEGIAIVGMAGRFPGAESVEELWANLVTGKESVSFFTDDELAEAGLEVAALRLRGQYVPARGVLKNADCFDAAFFGIHPREAEVMDPQQRVFLEACWAALERAGYGPNQMQGAVGVFAGATFNTYYLHALHQNPDLIDLVGSEFVMYGNEKDYLTTRVAYKLGLKGPALNVSTACSTSLVAVGQACQSLMTFQCDVALAGGVSVRVPQQSGYYYDAGNIGSPDGHTRSFDSQAAGTVFSNGVAVVVLKRLEDAVRDGDQIYAVIKGAAVNNDGSQRVSFGAPGIEGQSEVIALAHALAGVDPETITYVEAHGTATPLGDPIEVAGLTKAFRMGTDARQFCALGSVKTNIGHLDAAAGVTGLIKTALALHHKTIPASLHFKKPNPKLELETSPFYINAELQEWKSKPGVPRRAGVSSFGTGGTNAHVVLEEAPALPASGPSRPWQLLTLSAKTPAALDLATAKLSDHLKKIARNSDAADADRELADAAFTMQTGRSQFVHRRIVVCSNAFDGAAAMAAGDPKRMFSHQQKLTEPPVVFMFPGQGAQYAGMGAELYRSEGVFRGEIDRCADLLRPIVGTDLRTVMFPAKGFEKEAVDLLVQTRFTQPALFVIEYALAKLWMSWGIKPSAMIGHSVGEYVAGCLAGVFTLEDALSLVARRGALIQEQPGGAMLAIRLPETEVVQFLNSALAIAAVNSPALCVVSGPNDEIADLEKKLESKRIVARRLQTSHAFHSAMMEPVLAPFTEMLRQVKIGEPSIPYVSNVTARWITPVEATAPEYWAGHVRQTVRFADGIAELMEDPRRVLLEVGPGQTLTTLARQHPAKSTEQLVLASLPVAGIEEPRGILETLGRLWMTGVFPDWESFYANERRHRTVLPTYPFDRKRYWPEPASRTECVAEGSKQALSIAEENGVASVPGASVLQPSVENRLEVARKERFLEAARAMLQDLSGYDLAGVQESTDLLELGLDSLLLTQAAQLFQRKFGVSITFRQLMEELSSLGAIACYVDNSLPAEVFADKTANKPATEPAIPRTVSPETSSSQNLLEQILLQQQQLTNQVLQLMGRQGVPVSTSAGLNSAAVATSVAAKPEQKSHGPFRPIDRSAGAGVSARQRAALEALIARYTRLTAGSKKSAADNRSVLADPRTVAGFNRLWKEIVYPIVTNRSDGSRVWDIDGNEYIDFVMGFGASIFGHRPPFVVKAVRKQLDAGFEIGPIQPLAGEVAAMVREVTGMERVAFTNTGSEAVLAAMRVSRTVTGRDKVAVFAGAYHGIFDEVLFRPLTVNGETRTAPISPGVPESSLAQVIVLDYGNPESLTILRARGSEIAAVLVEPVQSRKLDLQPRKFLHELRRITEQTGAALIFDEVVTGFRVQPGGAQAYFDVRADLATYGKVIGGGLPIGVVTGSAKFMDALDGGQWRYGDNSFPEVGVTFFAGTFVRHPLALAAAKAVLTHLKQSGPQLQQELTERTERLAHRLQAVIEEFQAPYQLTQFSSIMHLSFPSEQKFAGLLFYLMRERGIHIYENRLFILTTAHSDEDLDRLVRVFRESLAAMQASGFLPVPSDVQAKRVTTAQLLAAPSHDQLPISVRALENVGGRFPLTEAQKEIWLAAQMGGHAALAYNESLKLEFRGDFDVEVFRKTLQEVFSRHPILTATFSNDGQWQQTREGIILDVPLFDLSNQTEVEAEREVTAMIEREVSKALDLGSGPLVRVQIIRITKDRHIVLWTAHHIVCDGWSGGLVVRELAAIYSGIKEGTAPALEEPLSFEKYALVTQSAISEAGDAVEYWRHQFGELPAPLDLPTDRPRPRIRSAAAATAKRELDNSLQQSLKRLAGQQRTTQVVLLMAALKTLLYRLTGQADQVVGLGVAGQAVTAQNCLVGHCVNLLPIRTQLEPETSFQDNLAAVRKAVLDAYDHHQTTIGDILKHVKVPRSPGRPPLVEVIFNVDRDLGAAEFSGVNFACDRNPKRALHFDLFFNFVEGPRGLYVECDYNTDLFDSSTIDRWLGHYQTLLESIAQDPGESLGKLPILTVDERQEITVEWNRTGIEFPKQHVLHNLFELQAERTPDALALTFEGRHWTYAEVNRRANQLAHLLKTLGVGPDILVGLLLDRSPEIVIGILGILKAGGAYLPIDPVYPKSRREFMLDDAQAPVLLTQSNLVDQLAKQQTKTKLVCFDVDQALIDQQPDTNPYSLATPDDLAYVIYTSGSTGKPKGTRVTHYNVCRLMQATQHWFQFNGEDVWTLFHSHAFDFSVWELWGALLYGGRLVMVSYFTSRSAEDFYVLLANERITVLNQTPSAFRQLMQAEETLGVSNNLSLRYVIFGGEALEMSSLKPWFDRHGDQQPRLVNMYGITETTVHVTYRPLSATDVRSGSVVGVPIPDLQIYILDSCQAPVPIGVVGEIYVGGAGVACGYLKREELTAQRFLPDPFSNKPDARLYRTGDLARYLPCHDIEYLGRIDSQVKIRGFRIELGEIERVLSQHSSVNQCVVVAQEDAEDESLIAYLEPPPGLHPDVSDLRAHLNRELPDYMIPSSFMVMDKLPLTANGKIDRKSLPTSGGQRIEINRVFAPPRDPLEQMLSQLWAKVLKVKRVGIHDNFFELGGHSILAVRIVAEIERLYQKRLPLATLLQASTISALAEVLREEHKAPSWSSLVPIQRGGSRPRLFLMHSHGGNVLEYFPLVNRLSEDQPVYALQARGLDGHIVKGQSLEQMVKAYLAEIRRVQPQGPYYLGGFCFGGLLALEAAQQLSLAGEEVALVVMIQTTHPASQIFKPTDTLLSRLWQRTSKRIDLEREKSSESGRGYVGERMRRFWDIACARTAIAFDRVTAKGERASNDRSMAYILESLAVEHDEVFKRYQPSLYYGDVLLVRASKQLSGLAEDQYLGWRDVLLGRVDVRELSGHQQNLLIGTNVVALAEMLEARLEVAQAWSSSKASGSDDQLVTTARK